jgi:phosphatidylinositol N-acetylglucosaminyltransferase subunit H
VSPSSDRALIKTDGIIEESLLVLQGLGIQTSTSSPYYFVSPTTTFIPTTKIQDIVIHEGFRGLEVRFYLAVIVEGATEVVVVFPNLLPRLDVLQEVWRGARRCLYANVPKPA